MTVLCLFYVSSMSVLCQYDEKAIKDILLYINKLYERLCRMSVKIKK